MNSNNIPENVDRDAQGSTDIIKTLSILRRRWRILGGAAAISASLAFVWLLLITPIYTATTQILIDPRKSNAVKGDAIVSDLTLDANTISTEVSLIKSFSVARRVVERLKLHQHPLFGRAQPKFSFIGWAYNLIGGATAQTEFSAQEGTKTTGSVPNNIPHELLGSIGQISNGINVRRAGTTYFIEISYSYSDPNLAASIANTIAESYLEEQLEARYQVAQRAATWLSERVASLRIQLENSERALAEHRAKHNLVKAQAGTLAEQQATEINGQLVSARSQTVEKKAKYEQAQRILEGGAGIESVAAVMDAPAIANLRVQENGIARQEADLLTRYGPEHPAILKIRAEHADINRQIKREVGRVVQTLKTDYEFAQKKEQSLENSLQELSGGQSSNDQAILRLRELERDAQSNKTLYETLLARFKEAEQQTSLPTAESRIVEPAFVPGAPSYPQKTRFILLAVFIGLAIGAGLVYLLEYLEDGFTSAEQAEQSLHLPVLSVVPRLTEQDRTIEGRVAQVSQYAALRPQSRFGESIRSARLTTQMSNLDQPPKTVVVTSTLPSEGKTTIALALALSAAVSSKQRVLLIDGDLRARSTTKQFGLVDKPGLTDLLTDQSVERPLYRSDMPNLTVLPAGTINGNPPDLLGSGRMRAMIATLRSSYDIIYMDAPPLMPVIDAVVLSKLADKIVYVVQWRKTPRKITQRAVQMLDNWQEKIAGVVLNGAFLQQLQSYDPQYVYYGKKYNEYYTNN